MKTFTGIALALLVGMGVGYGGYSIVNKADTPVAPVVTETPKAEPAAEIAAPEKVHGPDDPVVAKVNGAPVYRTDVLDFIKTLPPQMQQVDPKSIFPMALEQVVNGKIVDEKAKAENLSQDPDVVKRMADAKLQIVRAVYAEHAIAKDFSQEAVQKAYDDIVKNMPKVEEVHARHILVDSEKQAKDIIVKLNAGAKFEDLAKEFSKDKANSASGGDLGYFAQTDMVKEFADAAFALKANEYTKAPVKTQFGFHVIQSLDKRARPAPKLEDVKTQLEAQVRRDILNKLVGTWRSGATVEEFDYDGKPVAKAETAPATTSATAPATTEPAKADAVKAGETKPAEEAKPADAPATTPADTSAAPVVAPDAKPADTKKAE